MLACSRRSHVGAAPGVISLTCRWTLYAVIVFVLLAGGYSLRNGAGTSPKSSGKERSGRTLAEQLEQQQDSNVASAITDENTVQLHKQARHGLRSYAGREHKLQVQSLLLKSCSDFSDSFL